MNNQSKQIEEEILNSAIKVIDTWNNKLKSKGVEIVNDPIYRSGENETYFSEIEFVLWKDNDLAAFFSIIIFLEGKQLIQLDEVAEFIDDEVNISLESIKVKSKT